MGQRSKQGGPVISVHQRFSPRSWRNPSGSSGYPACRSGQRSPKSKHDPSMDLEHSQQLAVPTKAAFVLAPAPFFFNQASVVGQQRSLDVSQHRLPAKADLMISSSGRERLMMETA
ncbi:hypothetical protein ACLOJK_027318 [Asimina triloba]